MLNITQNERCLSMAGAFLGFSPAARRDMASQLCAGNVPALFQFE